MRYFFHLRIGAALSPDEIGLELPDLETAYLEAFEAAQEMWVELLAERHDPLIRTFEIADEDGQVLLVLPFAEVLERARKPLPLPTNRALQEVFRERRILMSSLKEKIKALQRTLENTRRRLEESRAIVTRSFH